MRHSSAEVEPRYVWLSTPDKQNGVSCGSPIHFAGRRSSTASKIKPIIVTEGALKAETAQIFKSSFDFIASGGVTCLHDKIISAARLRPLLLAFTAIGLKTATSPALSRDCYIYAFRTAQSLNTTSRSKF